MSQEGIDAYDKETASGNYSDLLAATLNWVHYVLEVFNRRILKDNVCIFCVSRNNIVYEKNATSSQQEAVGYK